MFKIKPEHNTVTKTIRLPDNMTAKLERLANDNNISFTVLVTQCLQYALDNISTEEDE